MPRFEDLRDEYSRMWESVQIRPERRAIVEASAKRIMSKRARYQAVSSETGVPWYVVGIIHKMEANCNFACHLHEGSPLSERTKYVPKGRPVSGSPPFGWKESAVDAVRYDGLDKNTDWSPAGIAWCLEKYNGWGYRSKGIPSPYLWSMSGHYTRGKYVRDGVWDANAVSQQSGGMALLKALTELDPSVLPVGDEASPSDFPTPMLPADESERLPRTKPPSAVETATRSKSLWALLNAKVLVVVGLMTDWLQQAFEWVMWAIGVLPSVTSEVKPGIEQSEQLATWLKLPWAKISLGVVLACLVVAFVRHLADKRKMEGAS